MKTNEIITGLRKLCGQGTEYRRTVCRLAADLLEHQQKRIEELEQLRAERRWIPVTERLPEDLCPVLVTLKGLKVAFVGRYQEPEWWSEGAGSRPFVLEVTHWMPVPVKEAHP